MLRTPWFLACSLVFFGCVPFVDNPNNGSDGDLTIVATSDPIAVGDTFTVTVSHAGTTLDWCPPIPNARCFGHEKWDGQAVAGLIDAHCDGPCRATLDETGLHVTGTGNGTATLHVEARLADGSTRSDETTLTFLTVDRLRFAECYVCNGYALLPGGEFKGRLVAEHVEAGRVTPLATAGTVELTGDVLESTIPEAGALIPAFTGDLLLHARKAGRATIRWRDGGLDRSWEFRVADVGDLAHGDLYDVVGHEGSPDADHPFTLTPAKATVITETEHEYFVGWALGDGTLAVGGAGWVSASPSTVSVNAVASAEVTDEQRTGAPSFRLFAPAPGEIRLQASLGNARLDTTVTSQPWTGRP